MQGVVLHDGRNVDYAYRMRTLQRGDGVLWQQRPHGVPHGYVQRAWQRDLHTVRKRQQVQRRRRDILFDVCGGIHHFRWHGGRCDAHNVFALPPRVGLRWYEQIHDLHSGEIQPWQQQRVPGMRRRQSLQWVRREQLQHVRPGFVQLTGKL